MTSGARLAAVRAGAIEWTEAWHTMATPSDMRKRPILTKKIENLEMAKKNRGLVNEPAIQLRQVFNFQTNE